MLSTGLRPERPQRHEQDGGAGLPRPAGAIRGRWPAAQHGWHTSALRPPTRRCACPAKGDSAQHRPEEPGARSGASARGGRLCRPGAGAVGGLSGGGRCCGASRFERWIASNSSRLRPEPTATHVSGTRRGGPASAVSCRRRWSRPGAGRLRRRARCPVHDVGGELGRRLVEGGPDGVDDLRDGLVEGARAPLRNRGPRSSAGR